MSSGLRDRFRFWWILLAAGLSRKLSSLRSCKTTSISDLRALFRPLTSKDPFIALPPLMATSGAHRRKANSHGKRRIGPKSSKKQRPADSRGRVGGKFQYGKEVRRQGFSFSSGRAEADTMG